MPTSALIAEWLILTEASALSAVAVLPYAAAQKGRRVDAALLLRTWVAAQFLFGLVTAVGLALGRRLHLGAPFIQALLQGEPISIRPIVVLTWCAAGVCLAAVLWVLDAVFFSGARRSLAAAQISTPTPLLRLGAVLYGGIAEEVLTRLGILTIAAFVIAVLLDAAGWPSPGAALGLATVISAVAFGLGHLPSAARLAPLTASVVLRSTLLNSLAGLVFGTLFCLYGLEAAIVAHGSADLMFLFVVPLLRRC